MIGSGIQFGTLTRRYQLFTRRLQERASYNRSQSRTVRIAAVANCGDAKTLVRRGKVYRHPKRSDPFLERDRDTCVRAQANLVSFDFGNEGARHIMPVTGMASLSRIRPGEANARAVERIDRPDMHAICADHFHSRLHAFNP
jgi:hypothetical protein